MQDINFTTLLVLVQTCSVTMSWTARILEVAASGSILGNFGLAGGICAGGVRCGLGPMLP